LTTTPKLGRLAVLAGLLSCSAFLVFAGSASAATTTLTFMEPEKGSTFNFVDAPPTAAIKHGFPTSFSPGDVLVLTNPLKQGSKTIGKLRAKCTATANAKLSSANAFVDAHFICEGVFFLGKSTLYASATIVKGGTEGVITGGTGSYVGTRGTLISKEGKGGSTTTVTLLE
jgi:hypothetical protein